MAKGVGFYNSDWFKIKTGKDLLYESIIRILMTAPNERVRQSDFGVGLKRKLFLPLTPDKLQDLVIDVHSAIDNFEPRVTVNEVRAEILDSHSIKIYIDLINETGDEETASFIYKVGV